MDYYSIQSIPSLPLTYYQYSNFNKPNKYYTVQCINCGYYGHTIKNCYQPITSYGIICYYRDNNANNNANDNSNKLKYLMIQRKDSLCYVEFLRGRYHLDKVYYIVELLKYLTPQERHMIRKWDFIDLWKKLWKFYSNDKFQREYLTAKKKFELLKYGYINTKGKYVNLYSLMNVAERNMKDKSQCYNDTEWEFPKGRRNTFETNLDCAVREFEEESGLMRNELQIINPNYFYEEIYQAVNGIQYRNVYYIAKCSEMHPSLFNKNNLMQIKEVKDVKWFDSDEVLTNLRDIYSERIDLFQQVDAYVRNIEHL